MSKSICRSICAVDEENLFCIGCGRTISEIEEWFSASQSRKIEIAREVRRRKHERKNLNDTGSDNKDSC